MLPLAFFLLAEHEAHSSVPALLDAESWGLVFWTGITFMAVLFILKKTAWGPILESLEKREKTIADQIAAAQHDRAEAAKVLEEHKKALAQVRNEAQAILNEAAADQKRMLDEAHAKSMAESEEIKQRALKDIELAKHKALDELKQTSIQLALGIAEKVIGSEVDRQKQRRLVDEFIQSYDRN